MTILGAKRVSSESIQMGRKLSGEFFSIRMKGYDNFSPSGKLRKEMRSLDRVGTSSVAYLALEYFWMIRTSAARVRRAWHESMGGRRREKYLEEYICGVECDLGLCQQSDRKCRNCYNRQGDTYSSQPSLSRRSLSPSPIYLPTPVRLVFTRAHHVSHCRPYCVLQAYNR